MMRRSASSSIAAALLCLAMVRPAGADTGPALSVPQALLAAAVWCDASVSPGSGRQTVLLIHGFAETGEAWRPWVPHLARDYRVLRAESGPAALEIVRELKVRNSAVALFLVDQRMPGLSGVEFLEQAITIYPNAKRVLLTAYADTDAAIAAINEAGINHYLLKPWDPPEENLYPVLDELLEDWQAEFPVIPGSAACPTK